MSWKSEVLAWGSIALISASVLAGEALKMTAEQSGGRTAPELVERTGVRSAVGGVRGLAGRSARQGGDTCAGAVDISGPLPISVSGTTTGYNDDYDGFNGVSLECPHAGSTSPDVVYLYTPGEDVKVDISLCEGMTDYDSKLYVYEAQCPAAEYVVCVDDACPSAVGQVFPIVSRAIGVELSGGVDYYIVIDGYGGDAGDYYLDITEWVPPVDYCPPGSLYSQTRHEPDGPWTAGNSDANTTDGFLRYESFAVDAPICDVHFWGLDLIWTADAWIECADPYPTFHVQFYEDVSGQPGAAVCSYDVMAERTPTGLVYATSELNEYSAGLLPCCELTAGWVSVQGFGVDPRCNFLWLSGAVGDESAWLWDGSALELDDFDLSLCLTGDYVSTTGACCDDVSGHCDDDVEEVNCAWPLRFESETACAELDPACGQTTGACCYPDATCAIATQAECVGGDWLGRDTTCGMCPCTVPCPAGGVVEAEACGVDTNAGCNLDPPVFESIACGQTVCGTIWADDNTLDADWYEVVVTETTELELSVEAEFTGIGVAAGFVQTCPLGSEVCATITGLLEPYETGGECEKVVVRQCVPPGTYWAFISAANYYSLPCARHNDYSATLTCSPCSLPTGACCLPSGTCRDNIVQYDCECTDGTYQGNGVLCTDVVCAQPPANDQCQNALPAGGGLTLGTNVQATADPDALCPLGHGYPQSGVWYTITGNGRRLTASTCNEHTAFDSKLFVYCSAEDSCDSLWCVAFDDDTCAGENIYASTVSWCSESGRLYYLVVASYNAEAAQGDFGLVISSGDGCGNPSSCDVVTGACCIDGACVATNIEYECDVLGGKWFEGEDCGAYTCPPPTYCATCWHNFTDDWITNVTFNTIDHTTGAEGSPCSYGDYTSITTDIVRGETYTLSVSFDSGTDTQYVRAWFDWNQDLDFEDAGEAYDLGYGASWTVTKDITVPLTAALGPTRMRVSEKYYRYPDPCEELWYGESEDYTVTILSGFCGDLDDDGDVDKDDFAIFLATYGRSIGQPLYNPASDFDSDGTVTIVDYQVWLQCYRDYTGKPTAPAPSGRMGDYDFDGDLDLDDFAALQECIPTAPERAFPCLVKFDFDGDQKVGPIDVGEFAAALTGP